MASLTREIGCTYTRPTTAANGDREIEIVVMPVSDVNRAKEFYVKLGWRPEQTSPGVVRLKLPGLRCTLQLGTELTTDAPGSRKGYVIVSDIESVRNAIIAAGIRVGQIFHVGPKGPILGPDPERRTFRSLALFSDPDGNSWVLQENTTQVSVRGDAEIAATSFNYAAGFASPRFDAVAAEHARPQSRIGQADETWPDWYAEYMAAEQTGAELSM